VVTDPGLIRAGVLDRVRDPLEAAGIGCDVFSAVEPNPSTATVDAGIAALAEVRMPGTVVVALGGGSAMDAAKGIALGAANDVEALDLDYARGHPQPALPVVAVPTTAGTGSETNGWGVLGDARTGRKLYIGADSAQPRAALLDAELTLGLPARVTAATGIDALTHAVESLCSRNSSPYAEPIALGALRIIARWLPRAVDDGSDVEARAQMLLGAHLAGVAMSTGTGLGMAHAIGHAMSSRVGTPHAVMAFNAPVCSIPLARVADALGVADRDDSDTANAARAVAAVDDLSRAVGTAVPLSALGVTEELIPTLVGDALADVVIVNTPRLPTEEELAAMVTGLLHA
jgi:alcohol dehydrogenase